MNITHLKRLFHTALQHVIQALYLIVANKNKTEKETQFGLKCHERNLSECVEATVNKNTVHFKPQ